MMLTLRCFNMKYSNSTLVVAPNYKGRRISLVIDGKKSNEILNNKDMQKKIVNKIRKRYSTLKNLLEG